MSKFKISVIMSVYNVEKYIHEAVESVLKQTIGFKDNVQIVFVDDGSQDNSGKICDEYTAKYPENIVVVHKSNEGLAKARKTGCEYAEGELVNFFDPDDILSPETMENVYNFYLKHGNETDIIAIPLIMFGAQKGSHPLNKKFDQGSRVIDLEKDFSLVQLSMATAFFKKDCLSKLGADDKIVAAEDAKEVIKLLDNKRKLGVVKEATYYYRTRSDSNIGKSRSNKMWYSYNLKALTQELIDFFIEKYTSIPKFAQFIIFYDLSVKYNQTKVYPGILTDKELTEYQEKLIEKIHYFDHDVIRAEARLNTDRLLYLFNKKYGGYKIFNDLASKTSAISFNNESIFYINNFNTNINFIEILKDKVKINFSQFIPNINLGDIEIYASVDKRLYKANKMSSYTPILMANKEIARKESFYIEIPLTKKNNNISFIIKHNNTETLLKNINFGKFAPLTKTFRRSFYYKEGWLLSHDKFNLTIKKASIWDAIRCELKLYKELYRKEKFRGLKWAIRRLAVRAMSLILPKNIWLITDKAERGGDNADAFFTYLASKKEKKCLPIFILNKTSPDYPRIKKLGMVIPYLSYRHKLLHCIAEHTISAYSHAEISTPFFNHTHYMCDLMQKNKVIFLQHGVTQNDVSACLNKNLKNYSQIITIAQKEQNSFINGNYGYEKENIPLTGFPRHDYLYDNDKKIITIMPTFRRNLVGDMDAKTSQYKPLSNFEQSLFYKFYSSLLNSKALIDRAEELGYKIAFLLHPVFYIYIDRFNVDKRVIIHKQNVMYKDVYAESSLAITDYSSAVFDFSYRRKPIFYTQFEDLIHYDKGYFDYERDGFGEIETTLEGTINRIIEYMEDGCKLKDKYRDRIENFFAFNDNHNCDRVYNAIVEFDKNLEG